MKRKVASRKYLFCEKYSTGPEQGRLFPLVRGVYLVRKEGSSERKLLQRGSDALSALLSRSSCFHFALHDSLCDTRPGTKGSTQQIRICMHASSGDRGEH